MIGLRQKHSHVLPLFCCTPSSTLSLSLPLSHSLHTALSSPIYAPELGASHSKAHSPGLILTISLLRRSNGECGAAGAGLTTLPQSCGTLSAATLSSLTHTHAGRRLLPFAAAAAAAAPSTIHHTICAFCTLRIFLATLAGGSSHGEKQHRVCGLSKSGDGRGSARGAAIRLFVLCLAVFCAV
uniref:Putative secreted protein n=1 Tax=Anopheles darlingi TaxID=43151 RepID=A0A2M4D440_ANODA